MIKGPNDARVELRRVRRQLSDSTGLGRQLGSNCEARLMNDCEDAIIQQCQIDKRERCSTVPAVKCEPAGPPQRQCRQVPRQVRLSVELFFSLDMTFYIQVCGPVQTKQCRDIPRQDCTEVMTQRCTVVPREACRQVPKQVCTQVWRIFLI